jgi:hypothetical protein
MDVAMFRRHRGLVRLGAWFAIAALAWQATRTAARTRRLEHLTRAWQVAGSKRPASDDQYR